MLNKNCAIVFCLITFVTQCEASDVTKLQAPQVAIRQAQESDFETVSSLGVEIFTKMYGYTKQEDIERLQKAYNGIAQEEKIALSTNAKNMIALVMEHNGQVAGYFSANRTGEPNELYARLMLIDQKQQHQGLSKQLLKRCRELVPDIARVVCLTNKKNTNAQQLYEYFKGQRSENPSWITHLDKSLNPADFVGYSFDAKALAAFDKKMTA